MGGDRERGEAGHFHRERKFAERLDRIGVEKDAVRGADFGEALDRLDRAGFVIGVHHRNQNGVRAEHGSEVLGIDDSGRIDGEDRNLKALVFRQMLGGVEHGMMLDRGNDEMFSFSRLGAGEAHHGEVAGFGATAGENDLMWPRTEDRGKTVAGVIHRRTGTTTSRVDRRGIAEFPFEERQHRLARFWRERGSGVVV